MRDVLKTRREWLSAGWLLPLVLLALPNCTLDSGAFPDATFFNPGPGPATSAIMCEIPKLNLNGSTAECATQDHIDAYNDGYLPSLDQAATWLAMGKHSDYALDWSQSATDACDGKPKLMEFYGEFPDGLPICLNCSIQIPLAYATTTKACIAKCKDLIIADSDGVVDAAEAGAYCVANARTAVNYDTSICYDGFCTDGGNPIMPSTFVDPRRTAEPVVWVDQIGTATSGVDNNTLTRTAPTTGQTLPDFNAGAASAQTILGGDAWIEFGAPEVDKDRVLSVRASCGDAINCPDTDPSLDAVGFGLDMNLDGQVYVFESTPLNIYGPFGPYTPTERYRVRITDNHNGTATISYSRIIGVCDPGTECTEEVFFTSVATPPYPLRVDTSFHLQGGTLSNVTIMRIKK